eukprot:1602611-Amphidinium_carterae.1
MCRNRSWKSSGCSWPRRRFPQNDRDVLASFIMRFSGGNCDCYQSGEAGLLADETKKRAYPGPGADAEKAMHSGRLFLPIGFRVSICRCLP